MWGTGLVVFVSVMFVLMSVALVTLFERKVLSLRQFRKGPNKTGVGGVVQPVIDGVKLLYKERIAPERAAFRRFF